VRLETVAREIRSGATKKGPLILVVDRNSRNVELLREFLERAGYAGIGATNLEEVDQIVEGPQRIALALVDVAGFDQQVWGRCDHLRRRKIPFLVISPGQFASVQETSLAHGAHGVLVKPLATKELSALIQALLGS
jgi:CheY-like chemotaxis protein